jgi:hypothetical protein
LRDSRVKRKIKYQLKFLRGEMYQEEVLRKSRGTKEVSRKGRSLNISNAKVGSN